ncbi:MAG: dihydroorotate dehydrogenase electron transfer subunit [Eubacteriales bacterium]
MKENTIEQKFEITENRKIADMVYETVLVGDTSRVTSPGQFVSVSLGGFFLRRPFSVCDKSGGRLTLIYKTVGSGTKYMSSLKKGSVLNLLTGLGNGFEVKNSKDSPLLIGGGVGLPPLYFLAKCLTAEGKDVALIMGFGKSSEVFYEEKFKELGVRVAVTTADGSRGIKGFVTDALGLFTGYTYTYACGPEQMLKAVWESTRTDGEYSFEERMGCGFGACMGCSRKTVGGYKKVCSDGPVFKKGEILW